MDASDTSLKFFAEINEKLYGLSKGVEAPNLSNINIERYFKNEMSKYIDKNIKESLKNEEISPKTAEVLQENKNALLNKNYEDIINKLYKENEINTSKLNKYCNDWERAYGNSDVDKMNKAIERIDSVVNKVLNANDLLERASSIKIQNTVLLEKMKNGENKLTDLEVELSKKFSSFENQRKESEAITSETIKKGTEKLKELLEKYSKQSAW